MSPVLWDVSCVMCNVSLVTCHMSLTSTATARDPPPGNSPTMLSRVVRKYPKPNFFLCKKTSENLIVFVVVFFQANITNRPFDQRSLVHGEVYYPRCDTHTLIHIQADIATYRLNRRRGRFSENIFRICWTNTYGQVAWERMCLF